MQKLHGVTVLRGRYRKESVGRHPADRPVSGSASTNTSAGRKAAGGNIMRKLMRSIARHNMEKAGIVQLNKRLYAMTKVGPVRCDSKFAQHWREYI